jgi:protocatechuate 3,4-dioxygenase beta subunit
MQNARARRLLPGLLVILISAGVQTDLFAQPPGGGRGPGARGQGPGGRGPGMPERPAPPRDAATAQPIPVGTAVVSGTVVVAGSGQPARRARVTLNASEGGGTRTATTDDNGRYAFSGLAAGRYSLSASKSGHIGVTYGATRPGRPGTPIQLADGEKFDAALQLPRGSVITGTVLDEHGEATPGTPVRAMRYVMQAGRRTLQQSGSGATDDRGIYRIYGLQPGEYLVSAVPRNTGPGPDVGRLQAELEALKQRLSTIGANEAGVAREITMRASMLQSEIPQQDEQPTGYATVYYPGTVAPAQAAPVALGIGEERSSIDFQLQRLPMARVEGVVVNSTGQETPNVQVTLNDATQPIPGMAGPTARADSEGRFRITNVAPGTYRLIVRAQGPVARNVESASSGSGRGDSPAAPAGRGGRGGAAAPPIRLWGSLDIQVDGRNQTNIVVPLQMGLTMSGRIAFEGTTQPPPTDLTRMRVNLVPVDPSSSGVMQPAAGVVDASGRFTIPSVVPGVYRLSASGAGTGWSLDSSVVDGQDTLDFPMEVKPGSAPGSAVVTFTDRQSQLSGTITNQRGQPAPEQTLILYPSDERFWAPQSRRIRSTRPATDGQFTFAGIPPGEYKLVAMVDVEPGSWFDPTFLQQIDAASTRITVGEGEKKVQNLQIVGGQ